MKLLVRARDIADTTTIRAHVERRAGFSLSRFADLLGSVIVRLEDVNGPRGGLDKRCRIEVRGPSIGTVVVEDSGTSWVGAVDRAIATAGRATARAVARLNRSLAPIPLGWHRGAAR